MSQDPLFRSSHIRGASNRRAASVDAAWSATPANGRQVRVATAVVYCEGNFGAIDGKTANGLVRQSEKYTILSIIDSEKAGLDAGAVLDGEPNGIPICRDLGEALAQAGDLPEYFIFGIAPASGTLSTTERTLVLEAIGLGMNIVNGLHEFLNDAPEFTAACAASHVEILDVRKPRPKKDLRIFSGRIAEVTCARIAVLGTACAIGKRTTSTILTQALNASGLKAVMPGGEEPSVRHVARGSPARGTADVWQRRFSTGTNARHLGFRLAGDPLAGRLLRRSDAGQEPRLHGSSRALAGVGHRCHQRSFQPRQHGTASPFAF